MKLHKFSVEHLYHFRCASCGGWWSIGDFKFVQNKTITCPHCTYTEYLEEMK